MTKRIRPSGNMHRTVMQRELCLDENAKPSSRQSLRTRSAFSAKNELKGLSAVGIIQFPVLCLELKPDGVETVWRPDDHIAAVRKDDRLTTEEFLFEDMPHAVGNNTLDLRGKRSGGVFLVVDPDTEIFEPSESQRQVRLNRVEQNVFQLFVAQAGGVDRCN